MLDARVIGEGLAPDQANSFEAELELRSGAHPIQLDYVQRGAAGHLMVFWRHDDPAWTPIPPSALVPPSPQP